MRSVPELGKNDRVRLECWSRDGIIFAMYNKNKNNGAMYVEVIHPGNIILPKKAKLNVCFDGEETHACTSGAHASALLKQRGHNLTACDVYNYLCESRRTPKLQERWPTDVVVEKIA